jgi:hypothetical protein
MENKDVDKGLDNASIDPKKIPWHTPRVTELGLRDTAGGFGGTMENGNMLNPSF